MTKIKRYLCIAVSLAGFVFPAAAEFSFAAVPDSAKFRSQLTETWFEAPLDAVRLHEPEVRTVGKTSFQVRLEESESEFFIIVAPAVQVKLTAYTSAGVREEYQDMYASDAPGSWVLVRDKKTGAAKSLYWYFSLESNIYVEVKPDDADKGRSFAGYRLYNMYAARAVPLRMPFERFYAMSFREFYTLTKRVLPWKYAAVHPGMYENVKQMVGVIRERLPDLVYTKNALYDEYGKPIDEETGAARKETAETENGRTLSSAGFVKWIADGLVAPLAGGGLRRGPLVEATTAENPVGYRGITSRAYSVSFALDWTRNLASAIRAVESGVELRYPESGVDVRIEPFVGEASERGIERTSGYSADNGYQISELRALLYVLAVTDPGKWYLGALRQVDKDRMVELSDENGTVVQKKLPELKVFSTCAAFFPYFDGNGRFTCAVFANCEELNLAQFMQSFGGDMVHLTRANASVRFFPDQR